MQRRTYPSVTSPPIVGRNQSQFKSPSQQQQRYLFQPLQSHQGTNYTAYLATLSLGALQKELQAVREKEKQFYKLNYQLKMLEKKSRMVTEESRKLSQGESDNEDQQIAQLKAQVQGVNQDIKNITEQAKLVKKQCTESKGHLKLLQQQLQKAKNQNYIILQQVNEKKSKLLQKSSIIQQLKQSQLENHKQVTNLRQEIKSLQQQSHLLESELKVLTEQKLTKQKNKQKLQKIISELEKELLHQKDQERQTHYKLSNVKTLKHDLEDQLISLRKQQSAQILEYDSKLEDYHNVCVLAKESDLKKKTLEDELLVVQNDLQELNLQFIAEGDLLTKEQEQNLVINQEFDQITKEAIDVWNSICELIKIQQHEQNSAQKSTGSNQLLFPNTQLTNPHNQIKFKALKVWKEIESILQVNQNQ